MEYITGRALSTDDDDSANITQTQQMVNTLYLNICLFFMFAVFFEIGRHSRAIYLNRYTKRFTKTNRVPPPPPPYPLGWVVAIFKVTDEEFLSMVGLDGYMFLRYITICLRIAFFFCFWGLLVLVPVYRSCPGGLTDWDSYTIANIYNDAHANALWAPVVFCYLFAGYFCTLMYNEYKNFIQKRVQYLENGDYDTAPQTYYTVMVEKIPVEIRSAPVLHEFFEKLFPGEVFAVEVALDLNELEALTSTRRSVRNRLEKAIAISRATGQRPTTWIVKDYYASKSFKQDSESVDAIEYPAPVFESQIAGCFGYIVVDAIQHLMHELHDLNIEVAKLQEIYFQERQKMDEIEESKIFEMKNKLRVQTSKVFQNVSAKFSGALSVNTNLSVGLVGQTNYGSLEEVSSTTPTPNVNNIQDHSESPIGFPNESQSTSNKEGSSGGGRGSDSMGSSNSAVAAALAPSGGSGVDLSHSMGSTGAPGSTTKTKREQLVSSGAQIVGTGVSEIAKTAQFATKGAIRGVMEATKALEILTIGTNYRVSSTAFVTFKSRKAVCSSQQMLLSNLHFDILAKPAPNPKDLIWNNISIPQKQINLRIQIADTCCYIGAFFWSVVVTFISAISNLQSISQEIPSIQAYSNTAIYKFLNDYLAIAILLILLAILPAIFDIMARFYEGIKLESEIQNSIMTRYFYYQLANVFVSVGLGSLANSLHEVLSNPAKILIILGQSLPSFSIYFANFLIIKTLTAIPIEMLRLIPLLDILRVMTCLNKKKCTRRELRTGAFADPPMLYGWIYPFLLMVLMIMVTYSTIAPCLMPFCFLYYAFAYLMYKYQLLYVYINEYQSGGFMWYAVFDRSMVALLCGVLTLLCYLAIRQTYESGPFYAVFPLPFFIMYFWSNCNNRFKKPALNLSLAGANEIDRAVQVLREAGMAVPQDAFNKALFRQPSLNEGKLKPAAYRKYTKHSDGEGGGNVKLSLSYLEEGEAHKDLSGIESPHMGRPLLSPHSKSPRRRFNEEHYEKHGEEYDSDNERGGAGVDEDEEGDQNEEVEQEVNKLLGAESPVSPVPSYGGGRSRQNTLNAVTSPIFSGSLTLTTPIRASDSHGSSRSSTAPKENDGIVLSRVPSISEGSIN